MKYGLFMGNNFDSISETIFVEFESDETVETLAKALGLTINLEGSMPGYGNETLTVRLRTL